MTGSRANVDDIDDRADPRAYDRRLAATDDEVHRDWQRPTPNWDDPDAYNWEP